MGTKKPRTRETNFSYCRCRSVEIYWLIQNQKDGLLNYFPKIKLFC